jgi:hypothetical protein
MKYSLYIKLKKYFFKITSDARKELHPQFSKPCNRNLAVSIFCNGSRKPELKGRHCVLTISSWKMGRKNAGGDFGYDMFRINADCIKGIS